MDGYLKKHVYPAMANWVGIAVTVIITLERAQSFAESQKTPNSIEVPATTENDRIDLGVIAPPDQPQDEEAAIKASQIPLNQRVLEKFANIKTKAQICKLVEGKMVTYYDIMSKVENCKQRQIEDAELFNQLVTEQALEIIEIPGRLYKLIPFGTPLSREGFGDKTLAAKKHLSAEECKNLERKYITASGLTYFFIENCKRRPFAEYYDLQEHNAEKATISSIAPETLFKIPLGKPMPKMKNGEEALLMKMDGDIKWNLLARANRSGALPRDDAQSLNLLKDYKKTNIPEFCKKFNNRIVTFYSKIFYLQDCKKRPIDDFSMNVQKVIPQQELVVDLTPQEFASINNGKVISEKELIALYKSRR